MELTKAENLAASTVVRLAVRLAQTMVGWTAGR